MKKALAVVLALGMVYGFTSLVWAGPDGCTTIKEGVLVGSDGVVLETGFNSWGYNYQAHLFNGSYCDAYHNATWCQAYKDVALKMKWNDAWLSNQDCNGDGLLDRHYGSNEYVGSGSWTTNHMSGEYEQGGITCEWDYFVKIVAAPADAYVDNGNWVSADDTLIGPVIWGEFAIVQQVENDPCAGIEGIQFLSPDHPGLGGW